MVAGDEYDSDGDGYRPCNNDCDDNDPTVNPVALEDCEDGVDNDCDGLIDTADDDCDDPFDDDDTSEVDDDDAAFDDDDTQPSAPIERRDGCGCTGEDDGGWALLFLAGLVAPLRRRRLS
ncbi:MAG: putative metal-binding motif-containing protein [Myxococcota bacterium]|nr:putative metal-binding motif-containing protein [Myxococcota bacterium]